MRSSTELREDDTSADPATLWAHHETRWASARCEHRRQQRGGATDGILITTTDIHLPRPIGEALHRAYQEEIDFHDIEEGSTLHVHWTREV
jgi:hypothetical protein